MIYVPIRKKCGTDFRNFDFNNFGDFFNHRVPLATVLSRPTDHASLLNISWWYKLCDDTFRPFSVKPGEARSDPCCRWAYSAYLSDSLWPTSEIVARRCLRSADTTTLQLPSTRRATLGNRAFPVAAARAWNSLPPGTRTCCSLLTFRRETNSHILRTADLALSI